MKITKAERFLYILGWIGLGCGIAGALFLRSGKMDWIHGVDFCVFHRTTGLYCPGCGITRASFALAGGNVIKSILLHPVPVYVLILYLVWMGSVTVRILQERAGKMPVTESEKRAAAWKIRRFYKRFEIAIYVMIGLLLLQWILKLLLLLIWHMDWFTMVDGLGI